MLPSSSLHAFQGPKQVDGRGTAAGQVIGYFAQPGEPGFGIQVASVLDTEANAVGGRDPNRWGAAHPQHLDRFPYRFDVLKFDFDQLGG